MHTDIVVVGTGYVGLTTGACLAHLGHRVCCVDVDAEKVALLQKGETPIFEAGLDELVQSGIAAERLTFTTDAIEAVAGAEFVFLCVPTPQGGDGAADLSYVEQAAGTIGPHLMAGAVVVNKSTVPVGSAGIVAEVIGRGDVSVVSNPEFLREGTAVADFLHPDRVVVGCDDQSAAVRLAEAYSATGCSGAGHRRGVGRDDQVRVERLSGDEGLLRERDRRIVRAGGRRCRGRDPGNGLRQAHRK